MREQHPFRNEISPARSAGVFSYRDLSGAKRRVSKVFHMFPGAQRPGDITRVFPRVNFVFPGREVTVFGGVGDPDNPERMHIVTGRRPPDWPLSSRYFSGESE